MLYKCFKDSLGQNKSTRTKWSTKEANKLAFCVKTGLTYNKCCVFIPSYCNLKKQNLSPLCFQLLSALVLTTSAASSRSCSNSMFSASDHSVKPAFHLSLPTCLASGQCLRPSDFLSDKWFSPWKSTAITSWTLQNLLHMVLISAITSLCN